MSNPILRIAQKEDCERLLELIQELADYEKAPDEVTVSLDEFVDAGFGDHPVWEAFVIEADGQIQGMALYYIRYSTWKGRRIYLEDIIVTQNMRGKGVGKQLMQKAIEVSEGDMALHCEPDNPAKFLYEKLGFTSKYLEMRLKK